MKRTVTVLLSALCLGVHAAHSQPIHRSVVAGSFFPATKDSLAKLVEYCSDNAKRPPKLHSPPLGIIAPHAGLEFSGIVAASAYRAVERGLYSTVVILGPSHFIQFSGVATTAHGTWETPLGPVAIDEKRTQRIMNQCAFVRDSEALFAREHSIETQLPFIQRTHPRCAIVPLELGSMTGDQFYQLSTALQDLVEEAPGQVLIVASSDCSHYHTDREARRIDNVTFGDILSGDFDRFIADLNSNAIEMCGYAPVITLMLAMDRLGATPTLLAYATTANATGDTSRVVGYGAVAFSIIPPATLSDSDRLALLSIVNTSLNGAVSHTTPAVEPPSRPALLRRGGLFVTLSRNGTLRGCIGSLRASEPLWKAASEMAANAACHDPRFSPVSPAELRDLEVEVSVLSPLRRWYPTDSVSIGTHGLYIVNGAKSGVLLPQVASDNHWDQSEFLRQVCLKAELPEDAWKDKASTMYVFTAQVFR